MKKLIVSAIALVAAVAVNAATCEWNVTVGIYTPGYDEAAGTAYFYNAADISQAQVLALFNSKGDLSADALDSVAATGGKAIGLADPAPAEAFNGFYAIVNAADGNLFIGSAADSIWDDGAKAGTWSALESDLYASIEPARSAGEGFQGAGWYTAVPEPTSGLLLLLGVAGLALRRRRA